MLCIEKIKYKNILSAGNQFIEVNLNSHSTTLVRGTNGQGKSLLITSLIFGLFGKSNRGTTKKQLVNSVNKKDCLVEIDFTNDGKRYKVRRGISPNIFEIYINEKIQEELSAVRDQQKYLEQNILKMSYKTFMQIVVLGSTNYIPFMELTALDRRDLIEELLDIKIFSSMNSILKEKIRNIESHRKELSLEKTSTENLIENQKLLIDTIKKSGEEIISTKKEDIEQLRKDIEILNELVVEESTKVDSLHKLIQDINFNPKKSKQFSNFFGKLQQKRKNIQEEISFFSDHSVCPTCKQDVNQTFKENRISLLEKDLNDLNSGEVELIEEIKKEEEREEQFIQFSKEISGLQSTISSYQTEITLKNKQIKSIQIEIESTEKKIENQEENVKKLKKLVRHYRKIEKNYSQCNEALEYFEFSFLLMKDNGIKSKIIENYLPVINTQINKYLQMMDLYINFTLDPEFKESVRTPIHEDFTYGSFSEGEKQRINLSLLLAWRDVAKVKNSVNCNIMFFDETLDSSLDNFGIEDMLKIINYIVKDSNVFIISHRDGYDDKFQRVLEVKKVNGFTQILS